MKKIFIILIALISLNVYSQEYLPTALEGSRRVVAFYTIDASGNEPVIEMVSQWEYKCNGDTIISDTLYKKVYRRNLRVYVYPYEPTNDYHLVRLIRDDIQQKKVYQRFLSSDSESLLFDFSLEVGDYVYLPITDADMDLVTGIYSGEVFGNQTNTFYFAYDYYYMEGLGSNCGFLEPMTIVVKKYNDGEFTELRDYCIEEDCESIFVSTDELDTKTNGISIYPQPATDNISFSIGENNFCNIQIFNINGKLLEELAGESVIQWDCENVNSGIYFYKVISESKISSGKIIVQ